MNEVYNDKKWIGKKYNMLTVVEPVHKILSNGRKQWYWKMKCDCGKEVTIKPADVIRGHNKSCGCYRKIMPCPTKRHGESHTKLHNVWCSMNDRCNPSHMHSEGYGKRGIKICDEWKSYEKFAEWARSNGFSEELTIERKDVNGNYCPENCTWIPLAKQARNRRTTHWVTYEGLKMSLAEACERAGLPYKQVFWRMVHAGWTFEKAITTPMGMDKGIRVYEHHCAICGKYFTSPCKRGKYCSHECYLVLRTLKRHGMAYFFSEH